MVTLILVKNPFSPQDGREVKQIEAQGTLADLLNEYSIEGMDMLATVNGKTVEADTEICDGDFVVIYPAIEKGGKGGGKGILGIIGAVLLSVVSFGVGGLVATGVWGSFAGASAMATMGGLLASATIMFLGSSLIARLTGQKLDKGQGKENEATYSWSGVTTMEGQNNPVALTYGVVKSGGQTIAKYTMAQGSDDYLYWLVSAGEGEVEITDIKLNDNNISLYKDVSVQIRNGTNDQSIIPYFGDTHFTLPLNYNMEELNTWYSAEAQGNAIQGVIIKIECPNGLVHTTNKGKTAENWVAIQIDVKRGSGAWVSYQSFENADLTDYDPSKNALVIKGKSTKAIRKEYRIDRLPADGYTVRVRVTERKYSDTQRDVFTTYFTGVSSIIYDDFIYPCTALIGIKAKATGQLSGGSPNLTFIKTRGVIYAYNPTAQEYQQKSATNPAWASYDLLHQCRYLKNVRTGRYQYEVRGVPAKLMRYEDFEAWASYCNSKHFNVNIEIIATGEMLDVVNDRIAPIGHGLVVRFGTKFGCIYSHPAVPVQMFGMGNIIAGSFHEEFLKLSDRANCVQVTYTNGDADYQRDVITVYGDTYDSDGFEKPAQITMDGCTKYSQAYREGVYQLLCNKYQKRIVTFEAGVDSIACTVGDVVIVSHDVPRWQYSGRVESVNGNTIVLPCQVDDTSSGYLLQWRQSSNDTLHERNCTIVSSENWWTTATITGDSVGNTILAGDVFSLSVSGTENKLFTIQGITRSQDFTRTVSCIEYDDRVFAEPENYDPDESKEILYSVMLGQMANETLTITARKGVVVETYQTSFTKQENGWVFDVSITPHSGYAVGSIIINGTSYGLSATNIPINRDYLVTAQPSEVGMTVWMNGTVERFASTTNYWYVFYSNSNCSTRVNKNDLTGKITVIDISDGLPYYGTGILGERNALSQRCVKIREADVSSIDVSRKTGFGYSISVCSELQTIYGMQHWNPISATSFAYLFYQDYLLEDIGDISHWSTPDLTTCEGMFTSTRITSMDLHYWNTPSLVNVNLMFDNCSVLTVVDISGIDTTNITSASTMFNSCSSLQYVIMDAEEIKFSGSVIFNEPSNTSITYLVPASMVASYKAHTNWSARADRIDSIDNYTIIRSNGHITVTGG